MAIVVDTAAEVADDSFAHSGRRMAAACTAVVACRIVAAVHPKDDSPVVVVSHVATATYLADDSLMTVVAAADTLASNRVQAAERVGCHLEYNIPRG